jgi:fructose-1,6-bisphosphatase/inositol monophosphatase family enzyme
VTTPEALLVLFGAAADAQAAALAPVVGAARRRRTDTPGQYALDLVADEAIVPLLLDADLGVVSEESGRSGPVDADVTVVLDPVDGSTNCSRGIPYWSISLCAVDADGMLCAMVANQATGERTTAIRGGGAWCDGRPVRPSKAQRVEDSMIAVAGVPKTVMPWKQFRALGSAALTLCDVADARVEGYVDELDDQHAPWDYLGGLLVAMEAGAVVEDMQGRELVTTDPSARRTLLAAANRQLFDDLHARMSA